jgi:hypothetical protein
MKTNEQMFCTRCGLVSVPKVIEGRKRSVLLFVLLLFLWIVPGLIYWGLAKDEPDSLVCRMCGEPGGLIPLSSPVAQEALEKQVQRVAEKSGGQLPRRESG